MFTLRNRDSEARQALCPARLAGHGPDEAGHTGIRGRMLPDARPACERVASVRRPGEEPVMGDAAFVVSDVDDGLRERLSEEIDAFNVAATGIAFGGLLSIAVRGDGGDLLAGLYGWTWGGCGYIDLLWVRGEHRGSGLGTRLLAAAEQEIRRRGCAQVALSTHSFQAPGFYARFGYQECGRTPAYPRGHDQIHLVKQLG
jgi:GNAT superfamily N-acetyltransferase